jgi:release factor glutamine methyltransferase
VTAAPGVRTAVAADRRAALLASLARLLGSEREARWIVEETERELPSAAAVEERAHALAARRATGEPLQYVLGRWPFRTLELEVDRRVLVPRPETEQVVEVALGEMRGRRGAAVGPGGTPPVCVDLGTGSGAIALSLAAELEPGLAGVRVVATDDAPDALEVAWTNLVRLASIAPSAAARVELRTGSWFDAVPAELAGRVDLLVSNPPYVAADELATLEPVVRSWEPHHALVAGTGHHGVGGFRAVETIVSGAPTWLRTGGVLVVELAPRQAEAALDCANAAGLHGARIEPDLAGRPRALVARAS